MVNIMTWDELNKKYPEARYKMDNERERAFLKMKQLDLLINSGRHSI